MRLFHVSEEPGITRFVPRLPVRKDLDPSKGLVWALDEARLPNFFTPRECPRVTYHVGAQTSEEDIARFFTPGHRHCLAIEQAWHRAMLRTTLYLYEFDPSHFVLQDEIAGYYVSERTETPIGKKQIDDLYDALFARGIELRLVDNLWPLSDAVVASTLNYSICDMANAQPR